jgi:hypothetical protein
MQDTWEKAPDENPTPDHEADAFISEVGNGYMVSVGSLRLATSFAERQSAEAALWDWTERAGVYPETWYVNERGNTELLIRGESRDEPYIFGNLGYV